MNSTLLEQFLGPSSTRFQLPTLIEEENDELYPLVNIKFSRLNRTRKLLLARAKSSTVKSRRDSDGGTVPRARPSGSIPTRTTVGSANSAATEINKTSSATNHRSRSSSGIPRPHLSISTTGAAASGAVDEAIFEDAFNATSDIMLSSGKDVENQLLNIRDILADTNNDWEKRIEALKRIRSIISGGGDQYDEFFRSLRQLDLALATTVKDLRSQIVREACITLAFMSVRLTNRFERTAEGIIPAMVNLMQNSAKIIATSGSVAMRYIVTNTQSSKLASLILAGIESKSKDIRRHTYELLAIMLSKWDFIYLEKHGQLIHDVIKKGLSDADADARLYARKAFGYFREHFSQLADALLITLDSSKKKALMGEMSNASSTQSLASVGSSRIRSTKDTPRQTRTGTNDKQSSSGNLARSSSANELALRKKNASSTTLSNRSEVLAQSPNTKNASSITPTSLHTTVSQPGSRSTSPNSLKASHNLSSSLRTSTNTRSRIPIGSNGGSRMSSRESSPGRARSYGYRGPGSDYGDHASGRRFSGSLHGDSADDASETSSICSERAFEDVADILRRMSSNEWAERKEGLVSLYHTVRLGRAFSPPELKLLTELLTKRFYDPNSQVFAAFLDVLPDFIIAYKRELNDWLYILLTRLLIRLGSPDILDSVFKKLKQCLSIVNTSFDVHAQFIVLIRFINDNSSAPAIKVKEILLRYLQQIIQHMEPVDITNNTDIRITLSKIINWSSEPKSVEMRKAAQAVILALHNLNRPEFNIMLTALSQNCQDVAAKVIRSANDMLSSTHSQLDNKYDFFHRPSYSDVTSPMTTSMHSEIQSPSYASDMRILMENMQALNVNNHQDDLLLINSTSLKDKEQRSMIPIRNYSSQSYRTNLTQSHMTETADSIYDASDRPAAINIALNVANTTTLSKEQRQHALRCVLKFAKLNDAETWDIAFSKTLNTLTQILDNTNDDVMFKVYSLRIIRELLTHHTYLFMNYIELTIFRILKAQSENENDITRAAEQAAHAAAEYLPAESTVRVLKPIIEQAKYPMNQSAITMLQKTIEFMNKDICLDLMPEMIPPLLTSWDNETSSVRKAAVFCLVSIYLVVGEALRTHLHKLSASKIKLLNVYISKAQQQTATSNTEKSSTTNGTNNTTS
ncbi:unnamed protein product [Rotaria sp. Silwood2]|nr:unnamed protein product [Rotaria sp. Silwood2]CAF2591048.1 unnamed protein product [Rotaria sp. Silwood2]CAF2823253.1 unnamed protein product [Rotaria sp. Silwood2]CAF3945675.1 unnamed protein product [Rotaria sp. Silwood2]